MSKQAYFKAESSSLPPQEHEKPVVTPELLEQVAERFRILGEPMRLQLVHALIDGEKAVGELVEATGATQANVSRHLQTLNNAGILRRRKQGLRVYYRIEDASVFELCDHVCGSLQRHLEAKSRVLPGGRV